jgi:hypothetical protein
MAGSIIQLGNQAFIVDAHGKTHEIIGSSSTVPPSASINTAHFLQTDDLEYNNPLVLDSMCSADVEEYVLIVSQDTLHASVDWRERRRNLDDLDLTAITAAPLPTSSK